MIETSYLVIEQNKLTEYKNQLYSVTIEEKASKAKPRLGIIEIP